MWWRKRGRELLRPHERLVLDAVRDRLDPQAAVLLDRQVDSIEMVQRLRDDREANLYPSRRGAQRHDPATAFPNPTTELRLATVRITGPDGKGNADVFVVRRYLFQIAFTPSPKRLGQPPAIEVGGVTIHADPMLTTPDAGIEDRLGAMDVRLRAELESMWADGSADGYGLASPAETYRIQLDDGDHIVLAQLDDTSYLVAPIDPPRPAVRRFWPDGELMREYPDLRSAVDDR